MLNSLFRESIQRTLTTLKSEKLTSIGNQAFANCDSLTSVNLPNVVSIGEYAFANCDSLASVNLPNVTTIKNRVFERCESLTSINLPKATNIEDTAFNLCGLTSIHFGKENEDIIKALDGYSYQFGAMGPTIYFDL